MTRFQLARRDLLSAALLLLPATAAKASATTKLVWGIDYGPATAPAVARTFDLLVLEPDHPRPIAPLRGPKSVLLGYISLGEVEKRRPFAAALDQAGALQTPNPNWPDARLVDVRHPAWTALVLDTLIPQILAKGYDGIFLDTLDNAEAMERADATGNAGMILAAKLLVKAIRTRFPAIKIMLNRGYALLPEVATDVDLILGEAMASRWNFQERTYERAPESDWDWQANHLRAAKSANPAIVLTTLDYWTVTDPRTIAGLYARERAAEFHPYVATLSLDHLLPEPRS